MCFVGEKQKRFGLWCGVWAACWADVYVDDECAFVLICEWVVMHNCNAPSGLRLEGSMSKEL